MTPAASETADQTDQDELRPWLVQVVLAFLLATAVSMLAIDQLRAHRHESQRAEAARHAATHLRAVGQTIQQSLSATYALAAMVKQGRGRIADFEGVATPMLELYPGVGTLQLAPRGVVSFSAPLAGNEKAIGHNLLADPQRNREAFLARDTGKLTLAGPFNLIQGGVGAVGRLPVFLQDAGGADEFWGFTSVLIRFPQVLDAAGLHALRSAGYQYVLWRLHPDSGKRQVIAASGPQNLARPVEERIGVPNATWTLSVEPASGWGDTRAEAIEIAVATGFTLLFTALAAFVLRQPARLRREVALRTRELSDREAILESLNELASDWLWTQDADFRFTWFSSGMSRILGGSPRALIGRRRWESPTTLSEAQWIAHRKALEAHEYFRDFEYGVVLPDGEVRYISTSGQPVFDAAGQFTGYRGTAKNITDRKRAEQAIVESETRFQMLFEKSPVALSVTTDEDGFRSTRWNQTWLQLFGYPPEAAQGKSGNEIGLWVDPATRDYYIASAVELGGVGGIEAPMRRYDGRLRRVMVNGRFIEAGGRRLLVTFYDDVTEERANERAIRELNATLESRIEERTKELSDANAELSKALEQLRRTQDELVRTEKLASLGALVAGVAHELNTPIGNCLTVASAFADRTREFEQRIEAGLKRSDLADYVKTAAQAATLLEKGMNRAHDLVASFKQVAVDQSSENRRRFDLRTVVDEVAAMLHPMLRRTPWTLDIDVPSGIELDSYPGPLGQVVANFVTNAITHAFEGRDHGNIRIYARTADDDLVFEVSDDGIGMPPEVRDHAFDPFFTTRLGKGGSGLGLHIVHNIVTGVLGGRIFLYSAPGEGCRFTIRIPLVAPGKADATAPAP